MVEVKDAYFIKNGHINCYYNHPERGWLPYTAADNTGEEITQQIWDAAIALGPEPYAPTAPSGEQVNAERERRLDVGKVFEITGYENGIRLQGGSDTIQNLNSLALKANILIAQGNVAQITEYRDADNIVHPINQNQLLELWSKAGAYIEACYRSSWSLKDNPPIPQDFRENKYWPA